MNYKELMTEYVMNKQPNELKNFIEGQIESERVLILYALSFVLTKLSKDADAHWLSYPTNQCISAVNDYASALNENSTKRKLIAVTKSFWQHYKKIPFVVETVKSWSNDAGKQLTIPTIPEDDPRVRKIREKMIIREKNYFTFKPLSEITFLDAKNNYTSIHTRDGERFTTAKTLKDYEYKLPKNFVRVNRSIIVNIHFVKSMSVVMDELILMDSSKIPISQNGNLVFSQLSGS